jgi:hypothetical protein
MLGAWAREQLQAHGSAGVPLAATPGSGSVRASPGGVTFVRGASVVEHPWDNLPPRDFAELLVALVTQSRASGRNVEPRILLATSALVQRLNAPELEERLRASLPRLRN